MKRTALALTLVMAVLFSTVGIALVENVVANPLPPPEVAPLGYRINSNGTCDAPNLRRDGDVYTFTSDIQGTIVIERDGIVLDGAGYTLQGNGGSSGIWLQDKSNITIKNLNIRNFGYGIRFSHYANRYSQQKNPNYPTNCTIYSNNVTNNDYGISLSWGIYDGNILDNYVANNTYGITFAGSGNTFRNNKIEGNQYSFWDQDDGDNDVDTSNTINGKPVYYWVNQQNMTVPDDAGLVILKNCSGIRVQNLTLNGNSHGISLYNTNNSKIYGNSISNNSYGIALRVSYNNSIIGNQVTNNEYDGINQYYSDNNTISNNLIQGNEDGIEEMISNNNVVSYNQIINNTGYGVVADSNCTITANYIFGNSATGIQIYFTPACVITGNNITLNKGSGITFSGMSFYCNASSTIKGNYISKNDVGISIGPGGTGYTIMSNEIVENIRWGIQLAGLTSESGAAPQNNLIHHNNFVRNNNNNTQAFVNDVWSGNPAGPKTVPGPANMWDDGVEGNYWSDYDSRYHDAQKINNSAIGNAPYYINENNQDNHPLLAPLEFAPLELPSIEPPQEADLPPEPEPFPTTLAAIATVIATASGVALLAYFKRNNKHPKTFPRETLLFSQCFGEIPDFVTHKMKSPDDGTLFGVSGAFCVMKAFS
jgi:parallel beta-helix repeat protein